MKRRVLYFVFQPIHQLPPCISEVCMLLDMGIEVAVLTEGCETAARELMLSKGATLDILEIRYRRNRLLQKAENFLNYGRQLACFFRKYWNKNSVLWYGSEESIQKMWPYLWAVHPTVLNALEFYEDSRYQRDMKRLAPRTDVLTACEPHRAQYMADWWGLKKRPYVLPNKPYSHPGDAQGEGSTPELRAAIDAIRGKKVLLYQGVIREDRDLVPLAKALAEMDSDYYLVLCGLNDKGLAAQLPEIYDKTIYLGLFPAPAHMEITPYASIGIAYYADDCINNRYCAPNKIYEYAGCGIPMLCNNIPGLAGTVGEAGAAECVDFRDSARVAEAIRRIDGDHDRYADAARRFFAGTDNSRTMAEIVEDAFGRTRAERK